jgi:hypothetical protein
VEASTFFVSGAPQDVQNSCVCEAEEPQLVQNMVTEN